ncbi:YfcL family protein [Catenovulum sp. 2E275]|uniref:YfcL family protein n=1 Tax=Catenovulum sp. 2E275 TaxID=2980497 RepID=UPI0021CFDD7A|nr:YfcL family protein [Catenovulum sp. 2E275]MCU4675774.1 YfcL family protein [Catenovulum sp. 2E275]
MSQQEHQAAEAFIEKIEAQLDQMVEDADADTLFISGYLRGHIMLTAGYLEMENQLNIQDLITKTNDSLEQAIAGGELDENDQLLVKNMWQQLQTL